MAPVIDITRADEIHIVARSVYLLAEELKQVQATTHAAPDVLEAAWTEAWFRWKGFEEAGNTAGSKQWQAVYDHLFWLDIGPFNLKVMIVEDDQYDVAIADAGDFLQ